MSTDTSTTRDVRRAAEIAKDDGASATDAAVQIFQQYSREKPEVVAMWAFGIGFVLGWKLKPW